MAESEEAVVEAETGSSEEVEEEVGAEEVEASGDDAAEDLEVAEEGAEDEGEKEAPEPEAEAAAVEPGRSEEEPTHSPFSFKVDGRRVDVEGASLVDHPDVDGNPTQSVVIPRDVWNSKVQPYMADQGAFARKEADFRRQIADLDPTQNETVIRAQTLLDSFEEVLSSEEKLTEFLSNFDGNKELWGLRADKAAASARIKSSEERESADRSVRDEADASRQIESDLPGAVRQIADVLTTDHGMQVHDRALAAAADAIAENPGMYYHYATQAEADQYGVTVGEIVRDDDRVASTINRFNSLLSAGSEQQTKTDEAREKNRKALTKKEVPPTIAAKGSPAPGESETEYGNKEDFMADMGFNT